jgi:PhnB protein
MSQTEVKPIPDGMHTVTPHLVCAGAADAIEFYKKAFNAVEIGRMAGPLGKLLHGLIRIGDSRVMLVDEFPDWGAFGPKSLKGSPVTINLYVEDVDSFVTRAADAGAKITMPVQDMFWGRSLRQARRPVWPPLVGLHTRSRCQPGRDATGGAESMQLTAAAQRFGAGFANVTDPHGFPLKLCGNDGLRISH